MRPWYRHILALPAARRLQVASAVIDRTVEAFDPPSAEAIADHHRRLIDRLRDATRAAADAARAEAGLGDPRAVAGEIAEALEDDPSWEADTLLIALLALVGPGELTAKRLIVALDGAYTSTLANTGMPDVTPEAERACEPGRRAIAFQKELLEQAASGWPAGP
jgi:hypothetical protein